MDTEQRFWNHVEMRGPDECWEWKSRRHKSGYGRFMIREKEFKAHRKAFEFANPGVDIDGWLVCHRCDNPPCCNPKHLWRGTSRENTLDCRMKNRRNYNIPTHCPQGHALTPDNLIVNGVKKVKRRCRVCFRAFDRRRFPIRWQKAKLRMWNLITLIAYRGLLHAA